MSTKANIIGSIVIHFIIVFNVKTSNAETYNTSENIYKQLTAIKCDSLVKANQTNPNFIILDVRTPTEWSNYHIYGSINHSTGSATFDTELAALPKHKLYLLHCQSGSRSAGAFTKMKNLGFAEVYEMIGGISAWKNAGLPTTTVAAPKLMLVSIVKKALKSDSDDTTLVTVTNRANGILSFSNLIFSDQHEVKTDFDLLKTIEGAQDFTFNVVHKSGIGDTTQVTLDSNGGNIVFSIDNSVFVQSVLRPAASLKIYPNPATENLIIDAGSSVIREINIIDLAGRMVLMMNPENCRQTIDVSGLKEGMYLARIRIQNETKTMKIVISR